MLMLFSYFLLWLNNLNVHIGENAVFCHSNACFKTGAKLRIIF